MSYKNFFKIVLKFTFSTISACIFYIAWLFLFLSLYELNIFIINIFGWLTALIITALGFAVGLKIFELRVRDKKTKLLNIYLWSLVGCIIGALVVVWFGPMLIVFGMFMFGLISIILREVVVGIEADK